jgi:hypothetical protein
MTLQKELFRKAARLAATAAILSWLIGGCSASNDKASSSEQLAIAEAKPSSGANMGAATADVNAKVVNTSQPADAQQTGSGFNGLAAEGSDAMSRKIMYKAQLTMQVEVYSESQKAIQDVVQRSGGYVLQFNESETASEKSGMFVIKVPANGFQSLLTELERLHPMKQKNIQGQDVTEEFVDLTARLKARQAVESRLLDFMKEAKKTDELIQFSNELGKVQEEIERIKGRMRYLEQNVDHSTIELRVFQRIGSTELIQAKDRGPLFQRAAAALNGTTAVLSVIAQWAVVIVAGALPVLVIAVILGGLLWLVRLRRRRKLAEIRKQLNEDHPPSSSSQDH